MSEFWGSLKRSPTETVDSYYNRFQEILDDLADADEPISTKSALRQFLFTLGPEFEPIQNNFRINNLPEEWKMQEWPKFLSLCRDYYNSVKPTVSDRKTPVIDTPFDKEAHQKKIRDWFLNPLKFCKHIENEQRSHPNKCIFHLSKTHQTDNCAVKKECDRIVASMNTTPQSNGQPTTSNGQLRHITEEHDVEHIESGVEDQVDIDFDMSGNNTNGEALLQHLAMLF